MPHPPTNRRSHLYAPSCTSLVSIMNPARIANYDQHSGSVFSRNPVLLRHRQEAAPSAVTHRSVPLNDPRSRSPSRRSPPRLRTTHNTSPPPPPPAGQPRSTHPHTTCRSGKNHRSRGSTTPRRRWRYPRHRLAAIRTGGPARGRPGTAGTLARERIRKWAWRFRPRHAQVPSCHPQGPPLPFVTPHFELQSCEIR